MFSNKRLWGLGIFGAVIVILAVIVGVDQIPPDSDVPPEVKENVEAKEEEAVRVSQAQQADGEAEIEEVVEEAALSKDTIPVNYLVSFDVARVSKEGNIVIAGRAPRDSTVKIISNGEVIGEAKAGANGEFVWLPDNRMKLGTHEILLQTTLSDGTVLESKDTVVVIVLENQADTADLAENETRKPLVVMVPGTTQDENYDTQNQAGQNQDSAVKILQKPDDMEQVQNQQVIIDQIDYDEEGNLILVGRSQPNADIYIYLDNQILAMTTADENGLWRTTPEQAIGVGDYRLRFDHVYDGKVLSRIEIPFSRADVSMIPKDRRIIVQPGNSLWRIARRYYGEGLRYTVIYEANRLQIRNPDLIYPGQIFELPKEGE